MYIVAPSETKVGRYQNSSSEVDRKGGATIHEMLSGVFVQICVEIG